MLDASTIVLPALGQSFELGMLYNIRTSETFAGISLWDISEIEKKQQIVSNPDTKFQLSSSIEETRNNSGLDLNGQLSLDLKLFSVSGSGSYLKEKKSQLNEAYVTATCVVQKQTRRLPQSVLANISFSRHLENQQYTHFVAEVIEGGAATISFRKKCSTSKEEQKIKASLSGALKQALGPNTEVKGTAHSTSDKVNEFDNVEIKMHGAINDPVTTMAQALSVACKLPNTLSNFTNTIEVKLLPLNLLDSSVRREIRLLDENVLKKMISALGAHDSMILKLKELITLDGISKIPQLTKQCEHFMDAFDKKTAVFRDSLRKLLPLIKDGSESREDEMRELQKVVERAKSQATIAGIFFKKKADENHALATTIKTLMDDKFEDYLKYENQLSSISLDKAKPIILFSLATKTSTCHALETQLNNITFANVEEGGSKEYSDEDSEDEDEEWFECANIMDDICSSCKSICQLRSNNTEACFKAIYAVGTVTKALPANGGLKKKKTAIGDIIYSSNGKLRVITPLMPSSPLISASVHGQKIMVKCTPPENPILPATAIRLRYQAVPNPGLDEFDSSITDSETVEYLEVPITQKDTSEQTIELRSFKLDTDYNIGAQIRTDIGFSSFGKNEIARTAKDPTLPSFTLAELNKLLK